MGTPDKLPYIEDLVSWLGIAWIIAFLAGLWGAMLGIGKFGLSEFLFLLCGAIILGKAGRDDARQKPKQICGSGTRLTYSRIAGVLRNALD
jgi:hypothetical protein